MKNEITLYIPTLNSGRTLKECIESIELQSLRPDKFFIVDGNSKDDTLKIAKEKKIKVYFQTDKGLAAARNLALKKCKTRFLASIDSDCIADRRWLETIYQKMKESKAAGCGGMLVEKHTESDVDRWRKLHLKQDWGKKEKKNPRFLSGSNNIFLADALRDIEGYDEKYRSNYEDVDISERLKKKGNTLIYCPEALCLHDRRDNIIEAAKTSRLWSFHSYPTPDTFIGLIGRLFLYNPHKAYKFIREDIKKDFKVIYITLLCLIYDQYYDFMHFLS